MIIQTAATFILGVIVLAFLGLLAYVVLKKD